MGGQGLELVFASAAVPVLMHHVTLRDYSTVYKQYRHLIDGGVTDNLGVVSLVETYDAQVQSAVPDLQTQVRRDFAPAWGIDADLAFVPKGKKANPKSWWLVILDNSDQAGALGYHDINPKGRPIGKVFAATDLHYGNSWTITTSHELLEMLGDRTINDKAFSGDARLTGVDAARRCRRPRHRFHVRILQHDKGVRPPQPVSPIMRPIIRPRTVKPMRALAC